ncbi:MAG: PAS domain-containing protein, partial [Bacillota bacterium]
MAVLYALGSLIWIVLSDSLLASSETFPTFSMLGVAGSRWLVALVGGGLLYWFGWHLDRMGCTPAEALSGPCTARDVAVLRAEALELNRAKEQLEAIVEASPFALMVGDVQGRVLFWNNQATRIFGWTAEEVLGSTPPFVPPEKMDEYQEFIQSAAAGNRLTNIPRLRRRKDGSILKLRAHAVPLYFTGTQSPQILAIIEDLTEATGWQTQGRKYELLAQNTPDIMLFMDDEGQILDANPAALAAYGYSMEELRSLNIRDLRSPETLEITGKQLAKLDEGPIRFETVHLRKDGSAFPVEVSSVRADLDGSPLVLSLIRDMTARKRRSLLTSLLA